MNQQKEIVEYDLRTSGASDQARNELISKLDGHVAVVMFAEDFGAKPLHHTMRRYHGGDQCAPHGYALMVDGTTPLDGSSKTSHLFGANTGFGVSRFRITSDDSLDEIERRWKKAHDEQSLPRIHQMQDNAHVGAFVAIDPNAARDQRYLIAAANDMPAALAMIEQIQAKPTNVAAMVKSRAYRDLRESSAHVRQQMAQDAAKAIGVQIEPEPDITVLTHQIITADKLAHQTTVSPSQRDGTEQYIIHNDTVDTASAHGGVLIQQGPMGGYSHVSRTKEVTLPNGRPSRAWRTETMSVIGANAPLHNTDGSSAGEAALHRASNKESRSMFDSKVHWAGKLSTAHPRSDERRTLVTQALVHQVAKPQEKDAELRVTAMKIIANQLPDHEAPTATTLKELATLAKKTNAKSLPVPLDSEAMRDFTRYFDDVQKSNEELADVMNNSVRQPVDTLHTTRSGCKSTDQAHYHYWYDQNEDYLPGDEGINELVEPRIISGVRRRTHERMTEAKKAGVVQRHQTQVMLGVGLIKELNELADKKATPVVKSEKNGE